MTSSQGSRPSREARSQTKSAHFHVFKKISPCCGSHHIDNGDGLSVCGVDNGYAHRSQDAGRSQGDDLETDEKIARVGDFVSEALNSTEESGGAGFSSCRCVVCHSDTLLFWYL